MRREALLFSPLSPWERAGVRVLHGSESTGKGLWLQMQQNHDVQCAEQAMKNELEKIAPARRAETTR